MGKSAQKNPPGKSPAKSSKIYTTKILQHISADCPGQNFRKNPPGTGRVSLAHPAEQTGVYRPVIPGISCCFCNRETRFCWDTGQVFRWRARDFTIRVHTEGVMHNTLLRRRRFFFFGTGVIWERLGPNVKMTTKSKHQRFPE